VDASNLGLEVVKGGAHRSRQLVVDRQQGRPLGPQDAEIKLCLEEGHLQIVTGGGVPVGLGNAVDKPFETETSQIVGHLGRRVRAPEERGDLPPELTVVETAGQMGEARDRLTERNDPRGSPKRSAETRCPASTVGYCSRSSASWVSTQW
jgi:hypothetical protein